MKWDSPEDAMPWVGLYVSIASLVCILAMAADAFQAFRQWKLWFPCRFFTMNAASITLIAIALKLPVDLQTETVSDDTTAKVVSILFLVTMVANFLPSLGFMDEKELLMNMVAFGIFIITISVNVWIQCSTIGYFINPKMHVLILIFPWPFSVAMIVPASRRSLQHRFEELNRLALNHQEINFSCKRLRCCVKKYWMMAETGNPQFVIARSAVSSAFGVICSVVALYSIYISIDVFGSLLDFEYSKSYYKWSINVIIPLQLLGVIVGSVAPIFRCLTAISHFNLSMKLSKDHLNVFIVEKQWIERLQLWKRSHVTHIPGRHSTKVFRSIRNIILNFFVALQMMVVIICNTICLVPRVFLILFSSFCYCFKSMLKRFKEEPNISNRNGIPDVEEYYVIQIEADTKLSKRILKKTLNSITKLLHDYEKKEPRNLIMLLKKSTGFYGVVEFQNDQVPPLHSEEIQNCWSLVAVTLTAIAVALPKFPDSHIKGLLAGVKEGLQFVKHIEESLNVTDDFVKARKAARRVWTDVEVYSKWLQIDLQKKSRKGKTSEEILQWLGDEAVKIVIQFMRSKDASLDQSLHKLIVASSMHRISQTILLHCKKQERWPTDEELFEFISTIIANLLLACFTNLPHVITMKCHEDAIEKREESIRTAAKLLGRSKKILKMLKVRQLPNLDMDSMGYIDKWHSLP